MSSISAYLGFRLLFGSICLAPLLLVLILPAPWVHSNALHICAGLYLILALLVSRWLTIRAEHYFSRDGRNPDDAFWRALSDARLLLSFVPLVGGLFVPRRDGDREL